jgi:alkylated DNA repair dioxygenase AlkB
VNTLADITYIPRFFDKGESDLLFGHLMNENKFEWQTPTRSDGKPSKSRRKMAYMASPARDYNYADMNLKGIEFTPLVNFYKAIISLHLLTNYNLPSLNSVLLNLYEDGRSEIRWHSDKEEQLGKNPVIPTLNLGASRTFHFLEKSTGIKSSYLLNHGDLLIMGPNCQENYLHAILKEPEIKEPRISLTFRRVQ